MVKKKHLVRAQPTFPDVNMAVGGNPSVTTHTHHHDTATTDVRYACVPCLCRILLSITAPTFCIISILMFTRMMTRTLTRVVSTFRHAAFCPSGSPAAARGASGTLPQCMLGPLMPCLWQWCEQCEHCQVHHEVFMECHV